MIKHFLNPPNWFTSASIFCSVYAMSMVVGGGDPSPKLLVTASMLIIFAGVFDLLDGRVARMTNRFSEFGVQLDSIADVISFGVAPTLLAWAWILNDLGKVGAFIAFFYVLCVAFRLARFNVDAAHSTWPLKGHSRGLTSTMSGGILVVLVWLSNGYLSDYVVVRPWWVAIFMLTLALLMVSSIPFRTFRDIRRNPNARVLFALTITCSLTGAVVLDPSMLFGITAFLYLIGGTLDGLLVAFHHRRAGRALPDDEQDLADLLADDMGELLNDEVEIRDRRY